jgi:hypothetical protein
MLLKVLQLVGVFLVGWFGFVNVAMVIHKENVPAFNCIVAFIGLALISAGVIF